MVREKLNTRNRISNWMKIATREQVIRALKKVFEENRIVSSQKRLRELVSSYLKKGEEVYHVSEERLRKLAIKEKLATVEIYSREGNPEKILAKCPVCGSNLDEIKNLTIWGGEVTIEYVCQTCGYWSGKKKRIPTKYVFHAISR